MAKADGKKQLSGLLVKKVKQMRASVRDLIAEKGRTEAKLTKHESKLLKKKLAKNEAKDKLEFARSSYKSFQKTVNELKKSVGNQARRIADAKVKLLKIEEKGDAAKLDADQAREAKKFANKEVKRSQKELEKEMGTAVKANSTNATAVANVTKPVANVTKPVAPVAPNATAVANVTKPVANVTKPVAPVAPNATTNATN